MTITHSKPLQAVGVDVQKDAFIFACHQADKLETQAKALYAEAHALRSQFDITVSILPSAGMPGHFRVATRLGGEYSSSQLVSSAGAACQLAYLIIQGCPPPRCLPPFGTHVDQTQFDTGAAAAESDQVE